jgi:hypothetical protein
MTATKPAPAIQFWVQGCVPVAELEYARDQISAVLEQAGDSMQFVRVKLTRLPDHYVALSSLAQVNLDVNGRRLRAQSARATMHEAIDEVYTRLLDRIEHAAADEEQPVPIGRPVAGRHEWRRVSGPTERPRFHWLPPDKRQIVRHKAFGLRRMTVDQAAFDMRLLGYQFHLFTETGTGRDSVLYLVDDDPCYRLSQVNPDPQRAASASVGVSVSTHPPPSLQVDDAVERLNATGWPFVFFEDVASGRGCVLYRRYDGHYGLITPGI